MHGMQKLAAKTLPTLIYIYLQRSQYNEARCYMDIYEKESGLFNRELAFYEYRTEVLK